MDFSLDPRKLNHHHSIYCKCSEKVDLHLEELTISKDRVTKKCELVQKLLDIFKINQDF